VSSIYHTSASRRFGASVHTYGEFGLGPKIPRCSRFTRERAILFWSESSWRVWGRDTTNELKRLSSFKCIRKINFPSQIGWAYHFSELHWLEMKWRRKCFAWYAWHILYCSLKGSLFFMNSSSGKIRLHVKHDAPRRSTIIALLWRTELCKRKVCNERFPLIIFRLQGRILSCCKKDNRSCVYPGNMRSRNLNCAGQPCVRGRRVSGAIVFLHRIMSHWLLARRRHTRGTLDSRTLRHSTFRKVLRKHE